LGAKRIARQQWRARIETPEPSALAALASGSPASNGGRGLKHHGLHCFAAKACGSPASNGGRGLKLEVDNHWAMVR